jgi:hypothetical protein
LGSEVGVLADDAGRTSDAGVLARDGALDGVGGRSFRSWVLALEETVSDTLCGLGGATEPEPVGRRTFNGNWAILASIGCFFLVGADGAGGLAIG